MDYWDDDLAAMLEPLTQRLNAIEQRARAIAQRADATEQRLAQQAYGRIADHYLRAVERLAQHHPKLDRGQVLNEAARLARTAAVFGGPAPEDVAILLTHEEKLRRAREEGFEAGRQAGRRQASTPPPAPPSSPFQSMDELEEAAAQDPEILRTLYGQP